MKPQVTIPFHGITPFYWFTDLSPNGGNHWAISDQSFGRDMHPYCKAVVMLVLYKFSEKSELLYEKSDLFLFENMKIFAIELLSFNVIYPQVYDDFVIILCKDDWSNHNQNFAHAETVQLSCYVQKVVVIRLIQKYIRCYLIWNLITILPVGLVPGMNKSIVVVQ